MLSDLIYEGKEGSRGLNVKERKIEYFMVKTFEAEAYENHHSGKV